MFGIPLLFCYSKVPITLAMETADLGPLELALLSPSTETMLDIIGFPATLFVFLVTLLATNSPTRCVPGPLAWEP